MMKHTMETPRATDTISSNAPSLEQAASAPITPRLLADIRHTLQAIDHFVARCALQIHITRHEHPGVEIDNVALDFMCIVASAADAHMELDLLAKNLVKVAQVANAAE